MNMIETCAICGGDLDNVLLQIGKPDRFEVAIGIKEKDYLRCWIECGNCGIAANVHIPENIQKLKMLSTSYYHVDFQNASIRDKYEKIMSLPPEQSDNAQRVIRILAFMKSWMSLFPKKSRNSPRVLDIGAGTGVFLSRFLEWARESVSEWEGTAIESDPLACEHLRSLGMFQVLETVFSGQRHVRDYSLCTLNKIVEHIENPVSFLRSARQVLAEENGVLYVEVPDKLTIDYRPSSDNILGALHYHLYDPKSLARVLEESGLVPVHVIRIFEPSGKITVAAFATVRPMIDYLSEKKEKHEAHC